MLVAINMIETSIFSAIIFSRSIYPSYFILISADLRPIPDRQLYEIIRSNRLKQIPDRYLWSGGNADGFRFLLYRGLLARKLETFSGSSLLSSRNFISPSTILLLQPVDP